MMAEYVSLFHQKVRFSVDGETHEGRVTGVFFQSSEVRGASRGRPSKVVAECRPDGSKEERRKMMKAAMKLVDYPDDEPRDWEGRACLAKITPATCIDHGSGSLRSFTSARGRSDTALDPTDDQEVRGIKVPRWMVNDRFLLRCPSIGCAGFSERCKGMGCSVSFQAPRR